MDTIGLILLLALIAAALYLLARRARRNDGANGTQRPGGGRVEPRDPTKER